MVVFAAAACLQAAQVNVYFGNLHSHTSYSDGSGSPAEAYRYARDTARLDFLAITEHNHSAAEAGIKSHDPRRDGILIAKDRSLYNGPQQNSLISTAARYTEDGKFVALYGQEYSTISSGNHVNVFEIGEVIDETSVPNGKFNRLLDWLDTHPDSMQLPAILQFNHPSSQYRKSSIEYGMDDFGSREEWLARMSRHVRLIEVLNGPGTINATGQTPALTQADYLYYLNAGFKLAPVGDQDNHWKNWGRSTEARTGVIANTLTKSNILTALRQRHVYATEDRNLRVIFRVNQQLCGDVIHSLPAPDAELQIRFSIVDDDEPDADYRIEVYSDVPGDDVATVIESVNVHGNTPGGQMLSIEDIHFRGAHQYLFFKITQLNDDDRDDRVWTAPVWFESAPVTPVLADAGASTFVASRNSNLYHVSPACRIAKGIKASNRITGPSAAVGRTLHDGCPKP